MMDVPGYARAFFPSDASLMRNPRWVRVSSAAEQTSGRRAARSTKIQCECLITQLRRPLPLCAVASPLLLPLLLLPHTRGRGEEEREAVMLLRMKHPTLSNVPSTGQALSKIPRLGRESCPRRGAMFFL